LINEDYQGRVNEICFNPHLASPLDLEPKLIQAYYRACQTFMKMTQSPDYNLFIMLSSGEMAVFDNRRVLHGCYVDRGEFESRIWVLSRT
jgi:gamma-butyrobetaine dioxygenase